MRRTLMIAARCIACADVFTTTWEQNGRRSYCSMRCLGMRSRLDDDDFDEHSCPYSPIHVTQVGTWILIHKFWAVSGIGPNIIDRELNRNPWNLSPFSRLP